MVLMSDEVLKKELDIYLSDEKNDKEYVSKLNRTIDKVKYLRFVKKYTQKQCAKIIGISERHEQRVERKIRMSYICRENVI